MLLACSSHAHAHDRTPYRFESPRTALSFGQGIVAGYGMLPHNADSGQGGAEPPVDSGSGSDPALNALALLQGQYPKSLSIRDEVDVPSGYACTIGTRLGYVLSQDATVTLAFNKLDAQGAPTDDSAWTPVEALAQTAGEHEVLVTGSDLPIGDYQYKLVATAHDGSTETYTGAAGHHAQRRDALPLAHIFVKGVDLYSGDGVLSEPDITIGGRGSGMALTRTYASGGVIGIQ